MEEANMHDPLPTPAQAEQELAERLRALDEAERAASQAMLDALRVIAHTLDALAGHDDSQQHRPEAA